MSGMDMMLKGIMNNFVNNLPPEIRAQIDGFGAAIVSCQAQLNRIETRQVEIEAKLDRVLNYIYPPKQAAAQEIEHVETGRTGTGSGSPDGAGGRS